MPAGARLRGARVLSLGIFHRTEKKGVVSDDNAMFLPKQEPIFENGGFPYSAAPPFRNMLSLLKSNDDIFPLPQTSPSASTPKTPPYTGVSIMCVGLGDRHW